MSDESRSYVYPQQSGLASDTLQLATREPMRGLTIVNQSTVTVSVFKSGLSSANATPDFKVYPGTFQATPLPAASLCALRFDGATANSSGQVYAHFTTDLVAASSGTIATSAPVASVPLYVPFQTYIPGLTTGAGTVARVNDTNGNPCVVLSPNSGALAKATYNNKTLYLQSARVVGIPLYVNWGLYFAPNGAAPTAGFSWAPMWTGPGEALQADAPVNFGFLAFLLSATFQLMLVFENLDFPAANPLSRVAGQIAGYCQ